MYLARRQNITQRQGADLQQAEEGLRLKLKLKQKSGAGGVASPSSDARGEMDQVCRKTGRQDVEISAAWKVAHCTLCALHNVCTAHVLHCTM